MVRRVVNMDNFKHHIKSASTQNLAAAKGFLIITTAKISSTVSLNLPSGLDQSVTASNTSPPESGVLQHNVFLIHAAPCFQKYMSPFFLPLCSYNKPLIP